MEKDWGRETSVFGLHPVKTREGNIILFWDDKWIWRGNLRNQFSRIYSVAQEEEFDGGGGLLGGGR